MTTSTSWQLFFPTSPKASDKQVTGFTTITVNYNIMAAPKSSHILLNAETPYNHCYLGERNIAKENHQDVHFHRQRETEQELQQVVFWFSAVSIEYDGLRAVRIIMFELDS